MEFKDYYLLLNIKPSASKEEIKKAFRRLAMEFHPDKHGNNIAKTLHFSQIKEAYHILENDAQRRLYDDRYFFFKGYNRTSPTIDSLLIDAEKLKRWIAAKNIHQLNYGQIMQNLASLLTLLRQIEIRGDKKQEALLLTLKDISVYLPYKQSLKLVLSIQSFSTNQQLISDLNLLLKKKKMEMIWEQCQIILVVILALLGCTIIVLLSG